MSENFIFFLLGVVLGGLVSWLISHAYYKKASSDQKQEFDRLSTALAPRTNLVDFERLLGESSWTHTTINGIEVWISNSDNSVQISRGDREREFKEPWTEKYPDKTSSLYPVYLRIGNVIIHEMSFVAVDCGRIFVPVPDVEYSETEKPRYYWSLNSIEVQVCNIIGHYYIYTNLIGVAKRSGIDIVA
jgi:hypothetical protein